MTTDTNVIEHAETKTRQHMLSTVDNPYDPFDDYPAWNQWDQQAGYHTSSFLARITITSSELSEADQAQALEMAIDEIVQENVLGLYIKITKEL